MLCTSLFPALYYLYTKYFEIKPLIFFFSMKYLWQSLIFLCYLIIKVHNANIIDLIKTRIKKIFRFDNFFRLYQSSHTLFTYRMDCILCILCSLAI